MRVRISTTVDEGLLARARQVGDHRTDASLMEAALTAYLASHRAAEIDAAYEGAYRQHPLDSHDEWGDLASWHEAVTRA